MMDQLIAIKDKILEFWNKYTAKQKTIIICVACAILIAIVLLAYFMTRPVYTDVATLSGDSATTFDKALEGAGVDYEKESDSDGNTTFRVEQSEYSDAILLMGENQITDDEMTWEKALESDMTTSSDEKQTKATLALQSSIRKGLLNFEGVEDATVYINRPKDDGTIYADKEETSVSVSFKMAGNKTMDGETAEAVAYYLANAVGSAKPDHIVLTDTKGNLLFNGQEDTGLGGTISSTEEYRDKLKNNFAKYVRDLLTKAGYDDVEVSKSNIVFDMNKITELVTTYTTNEGQDQGLYGSSYEYKSTGNSGSGGIPGTESNGDVTDTMIDTGGNSSSEQILNKYEYLPNKTVQNIEHEIGAVKKDESSIAVVLTRYNVIKEETLEDQGALDEMSFDEYVDANSNVTEQEVPENLPQLVAAATGIAENNIQIRVVEKPVFEAKEESSFGDNVTNYLMVILTVLIAGLLVFVIIKGTSPVEVTEMEPELSVEDLLATTRENEPNLDEIELEDKSDTLLMIEKFVDENPEAVALLLRNWINDDWGAI
ncbi:MAG: hypothetical protein MR304_06035 [Eubacterium sp.]|nr:hypothetical protein [Eubacterium sp.]